MDRIADAPKTTTDLVDAFLNQIPGRSPETTARKWLYPESVAAAGPIELMDRISQALNAPSADGLATGIVDGLAFCLEEAPESGESFERVDRLPLFRARREAEPWSSGSARDFVRPMIESWVLAQHVYWSIGRGLADARARGKIILRLKAVLDEGGWTMAPGASPVPTPDRLQTALSLAHESGLLQGLPTQTRANSGGAGNVFGKGGCGSRI